MPGGVQCETAESVWRRSARFRSAGVTRERAGDGCAHDPIGIWVRLQRLDRLAVKAPAHLNKHQYRALAPERTGPAFLRKGRTTWQRIRGNHDRIKPTKNAR